MGDDEIVMKETKALMEGQKLGIVDKIMGRLISRKFFVFLTATGLLAYNFLDADTWGMIAMIYIGGQTVIDAAISWKHGK
tara:strand:- start:125 stop:364 length:240 start_codon:yes stop_codon:yes gene_type:complete